MVGDLEAVQIIPCGRRCNNNRNPAVLAFESDLEAMPVASARFRALQVRKAKHFLQEGFGEGSALFERGILDL